MIPDERSPFFVLQKRLRDAGVDRRTLFKITGAAVASASTMSLLAACGGDDDDDDEATATTAAPQATATTATAPTATTGTGGEASPTTAAPEATATSAEASPTTAATTAAVSPTTSAPADEQVLFDYGLRSDDPLSHDMNGNLYNQGIAQIWSGLLTFDPDFNPIADWAETWEANADASVWTFNLRPDNTGFSNGDPVTAEVFAYSWKRCVSAEVANPYQWILFDVLNAEQISTAGADPETMGVKAVDDWTFEVTMVGPAAHFPAIAAFYATVPTHPPSVEEFGLEYTDPAVAGEVVTNGAFKLTKWEHDVVCEVEKNSNYWMADDIKLEKVVSKIIPGEQGFLPYEAGEVDWSVVPGADLPRVQDDAEMSKELQKWVEPFIWKILPGTNQEPFSNLQARRALSHAIDRDRLNELTNGGGDPAYSLMPAGLFGYFGDDEEIRAIQAFDVDAAIEALVGTPFEGGQNWPEVTVIMRDSEEAINSNILIEDIAAQVLEIIGLTLKLQPTPFASFQPELWKNEYAMAWIRWYYDYPDPNNGYFDMFYSNKASGKRQAWSNAEFDALSVQGKQEPDPDKRLEIYRQAEIIMQTDVGYIPVIYRNAYDCYKPWLKGVPVNKQGFVLPNGNIYVGMWNTCFIEGRP